MAADTPTQDPLCRTTAAALAAHFGGRLSTKVVSRAVAEARHDLEGRIQPEALAEMLHHLARHRLDALIPARS
ncbi:hypothetical protein ACIQMJ_27445 [Actinosynnema sp. NPDC091369]